MLRDPAQDPEDDDDDRGLRVRPTSNERILTRVKSNYAAPGAEIALVLREEAFWPKVIDPETPRPQRPQADPGEPAPGL